MKKFLMVAITLIASVSVYAQEFMGIKIDGGKDLVINQFKTKGFKVSPTNDPKLNYTSMEGTVNGKSMELFICYTPTSKVVWKLVVTLPKQNTWYDLKNEYEKYKDILVEKGLEKRLEKRLEIVLKINTTTCDEVIYKKQVVEIIDKGTQICIMSGVVVRYEFGGRVWDPNIVLVFEDGRRFYNENFGYMFRYYLLARGVYSP